MERRRACSPAGSANMDGALADSVFLDVTGRTAKRLLELAGDADEFTLPVTQEELAGMVGASRERVNKAIAQFVRLGLDRAARPPLPHHQPRAARDPGPLSQAIARWPSDGRRGRSSARWAGRAGVVHEAVLGARRSARRCAPAASSSSRCSAGVYGSAVPIDRQHPLGAPRARRAGASTASVFVAALPVARVADHPVERHRPVEAAGRRRLHA